MNIKCLAGWRCGREAEGGGLLNRYRVVKPYRGFESLRLRHPSPCRASGGSYVYFLELSNRDIYVGSTDNLRRRFASHQQGHVVSTSKYLPAVLRSYVAIADEVTARRLERYFKSGSGKAFAKRRVLKSQ